MYGVLTFKIEEWKMKNGIIGSIYVLKIWINENKNRVSPIDMRIKNDNFILMGSWEWEWMNENDEWIDITITIMIIIIFLIITILIVLLILIIISIIVIITTTPLSTTTVIINLILPFIIVHLSM